LKENALKEREMTVRKNLENDPTLKSLFEAGVKIREITVKEPL
jgi:hypothetical protein